MSLANIYIIIIMYVSNKIRIVISIHLCTHFITRTQDKHILPTVVSEISLISIYFIGCMILFVSMFCMIHIVSPSCLLGNACLLNNLKQG